MAQPVVRKITDGSVISAFVSSGAEPFPARAARVERFLFPQLRTEKLSHPFAKLEGGACWVFRSSSKKGTEQVATFWRLVAIAVAAV
jgi:hypothetical protein